MFDENVPFVRHEFFERMPVGKISKYVDVDVGLCGGGRGPRSGSRAIVLFILIFCGRDRKIKFMDGS